MADRTGPQLAEKLSAEQDLEQAPALPAHDVETATNNTTKSVSVESDELHSTSISNSFSVKRKQEHKLDPDRITTGPALDSMHNTDPSSQREPTHTSKRDRPTQTTLTAQPPRTILDRLVDFFAKIIKSFETKLLRKLKGPEPEEGLETQPAPILKKKKKNSGTQDEEAEEPIVADR